MGYLNVEKKKWLFPLVLTSLLCVFLLATSLNMGLLSSINRINSILSLFPSHSRTNRTDSYFVETKMNSQPPPPLSRTSPPKLAYLISGSKGDLEKLWRTLHALYHPWNYYIVHLDLESPAKERLQLASRVNKHPVFSKAGNVHMNVKANMVTYRGPTMVANTLHACAILLKRYKDWDWFINLSASDYPLVTQDDLLYVFSGLNRELNFIEHTSDLGWKEDQRAMPLIIDPGLYMRNKSDIFWVKPNRSLPTAFKLFTGSAWMILTREFVEYIIWGYENLPRTLLMYYTNFLSSPEGYFQTVACNSPRFVPTLVNHDMHYISWDNPPKQHPHTLSLNDTANMLRSGAAFARKFKQDHPVLDKIDRELLNRTKGGFSYGGWWGGGDPKRLRPGKGVERLKPLVHELAMAAHYGDNQCVYTTK